jgi:hypothetical protein
MNLSVLSLNMLEKKSMVGTTNCNCYLELFNDLLYLRYNNARSVYKQCVDLL